MSAIFARIRNEPVLLSSLATAIVSVLVAYHLTVTPDQTAAIVGLTTVVGNFFARAVVTPASAPDKLPGDVAKALASADAIRRAATAPPPAPQVIGGVVEAPK